MYNTNNKTFHLEAPVAHKTGRTILPCSIIIAHKLHMQRFKWWIFWRDQSTNILVSSAVFTTPARAQALPDDPPRYQPSTKLTFLQWHCKVLQMKFPAQKIWSYDLTSLHTHEDNHVCEKPNRNTPMHAKQSTHLNHWDGQQVHKCLFLVLWDFRYTPKSLYNSSMSIELFTEEGNNMLKLVANYLIITRN